MDKFTTLLQLVLALFGVDIGNRTLVHHIDTGAVQLHSRTRVGAGTARFECLQSASGECHYVVYRRDCDMAPAAVPRRCGGGSREWFTIASGDTRQVEGLSGFRLCVGPDRDPAHGDCQPL